MKIAFANILYSKKHLSGGLGTHISTLAAELARRGHEVTILTSGEGSPYVENWARVVPLGQIETFSNRPVLGALYLFRRIGYMIRMTRYVLAHEFDIVETADGGFEQLLLAALRRRKCSLVTKLHGNFRLIYPGRALLGYLAGKAERFVVRRSDAVYASTGEYASAVAGYCGIAREGIRIIPYAIDVEAIARLKSLNLAEEYPAIAGKKLVFLSAGSSPMRKGADIFLETASCCERDDVLFVLSCNDRAFLARVAIPGNVLVVTELNQCQFYNWLRVSDVVVFPSSGESFCIAAHEAMLFGKPVVVSKSVPLEGIAREYPHCRVLPALQPALLAEAIFRFLDREPRVCGVQDESWDEFSQRFASRYGVPAVVDQTEQFYRELRNATVEHWPAGVRSKHEKGAAEPALTRK
jgi:glycosyltransferase involved in cell wall biosynthesis